MSALESAVIERLRGAYLFSALSREQIEAVLAAARTQELAAGAVLFEQERPAERFYWVESGFVKLARLSADGGEKVIELIRPGQTFAEALMFAEGANYPVTAEAVEPTRVLAFDNRGFLALLRQSPETCFRMMGAMSRRLHMLVEEIDRLTLQSATERVIAYLLDESGPERRLKLDVAKHLLAARLSIKPETLSRIFARLSSERLISVNRDEVVVHDPETLAARASTV